MAESENKQGSLVLNQPLEFSGNIFIYYAFDIGDDINLEKIETLPGIIARPLKISKHFKGYHVPLAIDLPHPHSSSRCIGVKIYNFGVISLIYQIPFSQTTLLNLRTNLSLLDSEFSEQSVEDAHSVFKQIKNHIKQARFFHLRTSYFVVQVDQQPELVTVSDLKKNNGGVIASLLRFETESLSEYQKNEILDSAMGYYRGDLIIIDTDSAFVYDDEYTEILDLFEFANIQHVELQYYDRVLDQQLNKVYQRELGAPALKSYIPLLSIFTKDPVTALGLLRVEISVIIERLESTLKATAEAYVTETYDLLAEKLELKSWKDSIDKKLEIIKDIYQVHQNKIDVNKEDLLSVLIIILIFIELIIGILSYMKG
ncbi:MAG: hypothetical protein AB7R69_05155 [Candidatus Babeliales bacterium]